MRAFIFLLASALSSPVTYAKGGPNPLLSGRSSRMAMDAMRCSVAETKAQKEAAQRSVFQKFLDIFH